MGPCYTRFSKDKSHKNPSVGNYRQKNHNNNRCSNNDEKIREYSLRNIDKLSEKKLTRKHLDEKYRRIPNFSNENEKIATEDALFGAVGLFNLGNTCFMNAAIQLLSNTQPLTDYFLSGLHLKEIVDSNPFGSKGTVVYHFGLLMKEIWLTKEAALEPQDFFDIVKKYSPRFAEGNQEDIQEFLIYLLDIIHEDLNRIYHHFETLVEQTDINKIEINRLELINNLSIEENNLELIAAKEWHSYLCRNRSIIVDLFQGQIKSTIKCLRCGHLTHKFEPIMYISVPIPLLDSDMENEKNEDRYDLDLNECLREFTKEERLEKEESFFCDSCGEKTESTKKIEIWKAPNILIIHFKRFRYTQKQKKKIETFINFPINGLDLKDNLAGVGKEEPVYDLFGVANHEGNLNKGHYFTYAKNDEDKNWYEFDDENVRLIKKPQKKIVTANAYLLFYVKTSNDYFFRQTLTAPELWPHLVKIQEALISVRRSGKIRSSTGIRESLRSQVVHPQSISNYGEIPRHPLLNSKSKILYERPSHKMTRSIEGFESYYKRNSDPNLNLINNYTKGYRESNGSQKSIKDYDGNLENEMRKIDNLKNKKKSTQEMKKLDAEEKNGEEIETAKLKDREHFIVYGEKNNKFIYNQNDSTN